MLQYYPTGKERNWGIYILILESDWERLLPRAVDFSPPSVAWGGSWTVRSSGTSGLQHRCRTAGGSCIELPVIMSEHYGLGTDSVYGRLGLYIYTFLLSA